MEEFACPFCDFSERSADQDQLKDRRETHLMQQHGDDVDDKFRRSYSGACRNRDCGFSFPEDYEKHPGVVCPACKRDHTDWYVGVLGYVETTGV